MLLIPVVAAVVKVVAVVAAAEDIVAVPAVADNSPAEASGVQGTALVVACSLAGWRG